MSSWQSCALVAEALKCGLQTLGLETHKLITANNRGTFTMKLQDFGFQIAFKFVGSSRRGASRGLGSRFVKTGACP